MFGIKSDAVNQGATAGEMQRTRERVEKLTASSQVGIWFCDLPFDELMWDKYVKEHFWLAPEARVTIEDFYRIIHPDDRGRTKLAIDKSIAEKGRYDIEYRTVSPAGEVKWIHAIGSGHYDAEGKPIRFDGVTIDITAQKRAAEALQQRTAQFEALFNCAPMGIVLVDADFKVQQVNPVARPVFQEVPDFIGRDFGDLMHRLWDKDYADEVVRIFRHTLETGEPYATEPQHELRRDRQVMEHYEWQINRLPLPDGRYGVVCYFRDVASQIQTGEDLRESRADADRQRRQYEAILSNTPDLAYVWDLNHRFTYINEGLLKMWGKTWDEAIGKNCLELGYEPWHAAMHDREIEQVIATKQPVRGDVPFTGTFGRRIYDYLLVSVFDAEGNVEAVAGTTRDVTERKSSELRHRLLVSLDDALRPLSEPQEIVLTAATILGESMQVDRCAYADIEQDEDTMNLTGNYLRSPEIRSIVGRLRFGDFGAEVLQLMREDQAYVVHDIETHQPAPGGLESYRGAQIRSVICVPLHKEGRFVAAMAVHMQTPRVWTEAEVDLVRSVASRCWESIERMRLQRTLRESENQFRLFVTTVSDVVYRMSPDWSEMKELVGRSFMEDTHQPDPGWMGKYIHPGDHERMKGVIREAVREKVPFELEHRVIRVDGSLGWTYSRAVPLFGPEDEIREWLGAASDVTQRRLAEDALRESEERYRSLFESIDEGFCVMDVLFNDEGEAVDYRFLEVNPAFEHQSGLSHAVGRRMLELVPHLEPAWLARYGKVATTGEPVRFVGEHSSLGQWFDVYAFRMGGAESRRVAVLFNNVTERKRTEDILRESEERARAASAAKDTFIAQLSHELRTPLTPVLMTAASLKEDPTIGPQAREAFTLIERNITLEARLIDDLLDLTRVTRGKLTLRDEVCDVHSLMAQALEIVRDEIREKRIEISLSLAAPHRHLRGDRTRLQQVFWNLLRNAVNFTPAGGKITVVSRAADHSADGGGEPSICVDVTDTGVGFSAEQAESLFQAFYQGSGSGSAGLGLGLAIARGLVDLHHGSISGRSEGTGRGATFTVCLPVSPGLSLTTTTTAISITKWQNAETPPLRLLVVEDHEATLRVLVQLLKRAGHEVTGVGTITEAVQTARQQEFDAVVSDLGLPDGTGIELMTILRAEHGLTGVALSGYGTEEDMRRTKNAGFAAHLVKPVNFEELKRALKSLAARKAQGEG